MKLAVLTNDYPPLGTGGAGRIAYIYNQLLESRGHEVKVWNCGVKFGKWKSKKPFWRLVNHLLDLLPSTKTAEEISSWKPEALITHNLTGCGFGTPHLIQAHGVRWVHVLHDVQLFEPSGRILFNDQRGLWRGLWRWIWSILRRRFMGSPDAVVSPTEWLLKEHQRFGFFKNINCVVIPNPFLLDLKLDASLVRDPKQILFAGRLDPDKGLSVLLQAWEAVKDLASKLIIVGDGTLMEKIKALNDPKIDIRGALPNSEVHKAMLQSGVVAVPSLIMENQPTVILEALAFSCRVVAADVGGVKETLDGAGWLVEPGRAEALTLGIKAALSEPDDKERAKHREIVLSRHNTEDALQRLLELILSLRA